MFTFNNVFLSSFFLQSYLTFRIVIFKYFLAMIIQYQGQSKGNDYNYFFTIVVYVLSKLTTYS